MRVTMHHNLFRHYRQPAGSAGRQQQTVGGQGTHDKVVCAVGGEIGGLSGGLSVLLRMHCGHVREADDRTLA
jgi:hypothetical protein